MADMAGLPHGALSRSTDGHVRDAVLLSIAEQLATEEAMIKQAEETEKVVTELEKYDRAVERLRSAQRWEKRGWVVQSLVLLAILTVLGLIAFQNDMHRHPTLLRVVRRHSHFVTGKLDRTEYGMNGTSLSDDLVNDFEFRAKPLRDERKAIVRKGIEKEFVCDDQGCQTRARKGFECPASNPDFCHTVVEQQHGHHCMDVRMSRGQLTLNAAQGKHGEHNFAESEKCPHLRHLRAYCDSLALHCGYSSINGRLDKPNLCGITFGSPIWSAENCCVKPEQLCELKGYGSWDLQRTISQLRDKCGCEPIGKQVDKDELPQAKGPQAARVRKRKKHG